MSKKLSKIQQEQIVVDLTVEMETMDENEFEDLYNQLDIEHQMQVDQAASGFADNAIGSSSWRAGNDYEDD